MPGKKYWIVALLVCCLGGCSSTPSNGTPPGAVVGRYDRYDYSPSVMQTGTLQQFWWCGRAVNPEKSSQDTDAILYESIDTATKIQVGPLVVLGETPGAWDSTYTCNPQVIQGVFSNPLGDGATYAYAMYYVGTANGANNSIGVAFSLDGIAWKKYPQPIIPFTSTVGYGPAQPIPYNVNHKQQVWLFYEDSSDPRNHHTKAISTDGIHFTPAGILTTAGLDTNNPNAGWADMAYDAANKLWYAVYNLYSRDLSTTGNVQELGSYGMQLYRIPDNALLDGSTPWQLVKNYDTNLTGFEMISFAGILRDGFGNLFSSDAVQLYPSFSNPVTAWNASPKDAGNSGDPSHWDIGLQRWSPADPTVATLTRYKNKQTHLVTTGWIDPNGSFVAEQSLGKLYVSPQGEATIPLYGCKAGSTDFFMSLDAGCEHQFILGLNGYLYSHNNAGLTLTAIYRCATGTDHFVSTQSNCEGTTTEGLLGYLLPNTP